MNLKQLGVLLFVILSPFNSTTANEPDIVIKNAWIAEAPPVSKVMAAYLTIKNTGSETINIINAESDFYSSIEFHETVHENGMARMIRHDNLTIQADHELVLKRGGPHLMLFNPVKPLKTGDSVIIKLVTEDMSIKTITVPVKKALH